MVIIIIIIIIILFAVTELCRPPTVYSCVPYDSHSKHAVALRFNGQKNFCPKEKI
jgi:hypothetical protein